MEFSLNKIGLFGGTFNPIHKGHISAAKDVKRGFGMDRIWLIPASIPPHKELKNVAGAEERLEMIRLAVEDDPDFSLSDVELKRPGPSYTIDTVHHFESILPEKTRLYFILGLDAFLDIETWKSYRELFRAIPFVVMSRPGPENFEGEKKTRRLGCLLESRVSSRYVFNPERNAFFHPDNQPVFLFDVTPVDISSTMVRGRLEKGQDISGLVPDKVKAYIESKGLYL